jgi:hypothetical protein
VVNKEKIMNNQDSIKKCVICHEEYSGFSNNSEPVCTGLCCDLCNQRVVLPKRWKFFEMDGLSIPDPVWLHEQRALLAKQYRDIEKLLDDLDNPCSCGKPSTVWLRVRNYPEDHTLTRFPHGNWVFEENHGGGDGEDDYGIYFCQSCYEQWENGVNPENRNLNPNMPSAKVETGLVA